MLWKLYVHPDQQGTGLGRALLERVIDANGDEPLWLSYVDGNVGAAGFYAATGSSSSTASRTRRTPTRSGCGGTLP